MGKFLYLLDAMRKGVRLTDAEVWKNRQILSATIVGVVVALYSAGMAAGWITWDISESTLAEIGTALGALLYTLFQVWSSLATSRKVGVLPAPDKPVTDKRLYSEPAVPPDAGGGAGDGDDFGKGAFSDLP